MPRIFNSIRQRLLKENRLTRYLVYAIGEIVLVVIGILIALSINNWNQERVNRSRSHDLLKGVVQDLGQDLAALDRSIGHYESRLAFFERHLTKTDLSTTPTDTLFQLFDGGTIAFTVTDLSYEKAKNLGISQLCSDETLARRINEYYTRTLEFNKLTSKYEMDELQKENNYWMKDHEGIEVNYNTSIQMPVIQDPLERRTNAIEAILSPQGRNYLRSECYVKERMLNLHQADRETVIALRQEIREYLDQ